MPGVITSLDTLCSQAYGSGRRDLVGVHVQRCLLLLGLLHIPVLIIWLNTEWLFLALRQDPRISLLAGRFMRVYAYGLPGFSIFEVMKRYLQAQGIMVASTYVLFLTAPINAALNYLLVWHQTFGIGFLGAPLAVAITYTAQAILLLLYIYCLDNKDTWPGFSKAALRNWQPMIRLSIPGVIMVASEWGAFEVTSLFCKSLHYWHSIHC